MKRNHLISFLLAIVICITVMPIHASARTIAKPDAYIMTISAQALKLLGLFKGVSDTDFDLFRPATRVEAVVMIIRLLGEEETALTAHNSHPFTDVPAWANDYIGYAYSTGITQGVSHNKFGTDNVTSAMYLTYLLRVLGYSDADGDFVWNNPYDLARQAGILDMDSDCFCNLDEFWRGDIAFISETALTATPKSGHKTISQTLIDKGVFTFADVFVVKCAYSQAAFDYFGSSDLYYSYIAQRTGNQTTLQTPRNVDQTQVNNEQPVLQTEPIQTQPTQPIYEEPADNQRQQEVSRDPVWTEDNPTIYTVDEDPVTEDVVYITPKGERWHIDPDCGGKNSFAVSLSEAQRRGRTPCQKCVH